MTKPVTYKEYEINYYDIDYKKRVLMSTLMKYFSDVAVYQAAEKGMDISFMWEHKMAWVLYKWDITISKYPMYGEKVIVATKPYSFRKFYAYRQYEVKNEKGEILIVANSIWFLIDIEKRKPMRIPEIMYKNFGITDKDNDILDVKKITPMAQAEREKEFNVRYSDIDTNRHVNNVKYVEWALETMPPEIVKDYYIKNIRVVYEKETSYGDMVKAQTQLVSEGDSMIFTHRILDGEGKEINTAETVWVKDLD